MHRETRTVPSIRLEGADRSAPGTVSLTARSFSLVHPPQVNRKKLGRGQLPGRGPFSLHQQVDSQPSSLSLPENPTWPEDSSSVNR